MRIPHDPVAFEEHFKDDDKGPLSNEGYMPYLNRYILDKVRCKSFGPDAIRLSDYHWYVFFYSSLLFPSEKQF